MDRRDFLRAAGTAVSIGTIGVVPGCQGASSRPVGDWSDVRRNFRVDDGKIHLAGMLLAPHPEPVRRAVARHREELDRDPATYVEENDGRLKRRAREAAARYMGVRLQDVGLTDSTTMGIGLAYQGVRLSAGQELLTTDQDYSATHQALELRARRIDVSVEYLALPDVREISRDALVDRLMEGVSDRTRVCALTWVHSSTGLKLPVRDFAERLAEHNRGRPPDERAILCLDGVHGLGVEDEDVTALGCDVFFAGTHKWMFAPRGTGVIWADPDIQAQVWPVIPTFIRDDTWGGNMSPGGFKPFEHQWSMAEGFEFHDEIGGRTAVANRIHGLAAHLKEGLAAMDGVVLHTPMDPELSSGIVCFDVEGLSPGEVVSRLAERDIIASVTPYARPHARFSPGLLNLDYEIERTLEAVRDLV